MTFKIYTAFIFGTLVACGPATSGKLSNHPAEFLGSCSLTLDYVCIAFSAVEGPEEAALTVASTEYTCKTLYHGIYSKKPCQDTSVGSCTMPAEDSVVQRVTVYAPYWTVEDLKSVCDGNEGTVD